MGSSSRACAVLALLAAVACSFDPKGSGGGGGGGGGGADAAFQIDADPSVPDSANDAAPACAAFVAQHFDACAIIDPSVALVLDVGGQYLYSTDDGSLLDPTGAPVAHASEIIGDAATMARLISIDSMSIDAAARLRVEGALPLIIASWGDVSIRGAIDVSSRLGAVPGAGTNPVPCQTGGADEGTADTSGGGGGGGGAFGGDGGDGGDGDGDNTPSAGGAGGVGSSAPPASVRGGCPGQRGGNGLSAAGPFADGGGAIQLSSASRIEVDGEILAGGAAGSGGPSNSRAGGSGGGSGGYIGLQAPVITVDDAATLAANGGGGGEGTSSSRTGVNGENGRRDNVRARGGGDNSEFGTDGGDGGAGASLDGDSVLGVLASGGGGGGGSVGFILLWAPSPPTTTATISPAAILP